MGVPVVFFEMIMRYALSRQSFKHFSLEKKTTQLNSRIKTDFRVAASIIILVTMRSVLAMHNCPELGCQFSIKAKLLPVNNCKRSAPCKPKITVSMAVQQSQSSQRPDPPLPPYSALSTPVYSLSTLGAGGSRSTMNLLTYASPISLKPRYYAIGLYTNTLSWENMLSHGYGVLQVCS